MLCCTGTQAHIRARANAPKPAQSGCDGSSDEGETDRGVHKVVRDGGTAWVELLGVLILIEVEHD